MIKSGTPSLASWSRLVVSALVTLAPALATSNAQPSACRELETRFDLKKAQMTSVEINQALFASADNGCTELARRLLADGASLEARDRLGAMPLARAARGGAASLVDLFL